MYTYTKHQGIDVYTFNNKACSICDTSTKFSVKEAKYSLAVVQMKVEKDWNWLWPLGWYSATGYVLPNYAIVGVLVINFSSSVGHN